MNASSSFSYLLFLMQTKLHESVCKYRQAATIATHDMAKVKSPLSYDAKDPKAIMVSYFLRHGITSGQAFKHLCYL